MRETKLRYLKAGEPITEGWLNAIVDRIERFRNLSTSSPYIRLWDGPYGKSIALALPQQTWARLSGSSSPYSFVEVRDGPGGTWVDMPNGDSGSANVYEVNGKAGLAGKVVPITWTAAGDWRFQWVGYSSNFAWTFNVNGCMGTGLAGATIELKQAGVLIDSCVTADGTGGTTLGQCVLTVPAGTYDVTITGPSGAGFAASSSSQSIAAAKTTNTTLTADADYRCVGTVCNYPVPLVLYTTDALGEHTLTWNGGFWAGDSVVTVNVRLGSFDGSCVESGTCAVTYELNSSLSTLTIRWKGMCCVQVPNNEYYYAADGSVGSQNLVSVGTRTAFTCNPLSFTFNVPRTGTGFSCSGVQMYGILAPGDDGSAVRLQAVTP